MAQAEVLFADTGMALGTFHNVFLTVLREPSSLARLTELRKQLDRFRPKWQPNNCGLTVLTSSALDVDMRKEIRDESTAIAKLNTGPSTIVVEGSGFGASAIRAFLSGIFLVSRNRSKIHGSVPDASAWLAPIASPLCGTWYDAAELAAALESTRAALKAGT